MTYKLALFVLVQCIILFFLVRNVHILSTKDSSKAGVGAVPSECGAPFSNELEDEPAAATRHVVMAAVVFRHGDRAPEASEVYACDPYKSEETYWPEGYGNLLKSGRQRQYTLGKFLRRRYESLLPPVYHYRDINTTSSDLDRTLASAQCVLAGLYLAQAFDSDPAADIVAPVIPVHSVNMVNDLYLMLKKNCPRYAHELDRVRLEKYNESLAQGLGYVYRYLSQHTCQPIASIVDANRVHTDLLIQQQHGYPLPAWAVSSEYPAKQIETLGAMSFYVRAHTSQQKRLAGGPLLTQIVDRMISKRNHTLQPDYKMLLYSGHDTTVAILLATLGYPALVKPDFGSSVLFELHRIESHFYVQVFYKPSGLTSQMVPLQFPACHLPTMCTLDEFVRVNAPWRITLDEWLIECQD